jgi:hypothetical protein
MRSRSLIRRALPNLLSLSKFVGLFALIILVKVQLDDQPYPHSQIRINKIYTGKVILFLFALRCCWCIHIKLAADSSIFE